MRYSNLFEAKYFQAFSSFNQDRDKDLLKEFGEKLNHYHYLMMLAEYDREGKLSHIHPEKSSQSREMWPEGFALGSCVNSIKSKSSDGWLYNADPELLSSDEIAILLMYPFWSRMGGTYEENFAASGDLYKWLCLLKEKVEENGRLR